MIAVIADDFTGAAEIGGIGLRHGLKVVIETEPIINNETDLLIVATDSRAMCPENAAEYIYKVAKQLIQLNPSLIFKKLDSVLRGNVTEELVAQMKASRKRRAIVIAANPVFKRIIRNGIYYIDNVPLAKTNFSADPNYPIRSSYTLDLLKLNDEFPLINLKINQELPDQGIIVGDVSTLSDLENWAEKLDENTTLAGASGFFNAFLSKYYAGEHQEKDITIPFGDKALFVLGSAYPKNHDVLQSLDKDGNYVSNIPKEIYFQKDFEMEHLQKWVEEICQALDSHKKVIVTLARSGNSEPNLGIRLSQNLGDLVRRVCEQTKLDELLIEGGSTTSTILKYLGIKKLLPFQEVEAGVIRMHVDGDNTFRLTTKPGSYPWPEELPVSFQRLNKIAK